MADRRGLLIILSSPSGAGKSTLAKRLRSWDDSIRFSVSATTRAPREGEVDGQDYHFSTVDEFKAAVTEGEMLEHAHVFGNFYGSFDCVAAHGAEFSRFHEGVQVKHPQVRDGVYDA